MKIPAATPRPKADINLTRKSLIRRGRVCIFVRTQRRVGYHAPLGVLRCIRFLKIGPKISGLADEDAIQIYMEGAGWQPPLAGLNLAPGEVCLEKDGGGEKEASRLLSVG
jgi:hypothetical protein